MLNKKLLIGGLVAGAFLLPSLAMAGMSGVCSNCHTMHNSQNGTNEIGKSTPNANLLKADCLGCHAEVGANNTATGKPTTGTYKAPQVDWEGAGTINAGGYFDLAGTDNNQHNVVGAGSGDDAAHLADGFIPGNAVATYTAQITCQDCHGGSGAHHQSSPDANHDGTAVNDTYRLLGFGAATYVDATGVLDFGAADGSVSAYNYSGGNTNMNSFCAGCHPNFHGSSKTDPDVGDNTNWIRHPVDNLMNTTMDTAYNGAPGAVGLVPVMDNADTTRRVMCISCHRPHGGAYGDLLRFNYATVGAGTGAFNGQQAGCESCHGAY